MEKEGLDTNKIIKTINNLLSANKALNFIKNKALINMHLFYQKQMCNNKKIFLEEAGEIIFKSFSGYFIFNIRNILPTKIKKSYKFN